MFLPGYQQAILGALFFSVTGAMVIAIFRPDLPTTTPLAWGVGIASAYLIAYGLGWLKPAVPPARTTDSETGRVEESTGGQVVWVPSSYLTPSRSWVTFGAFASLGLALASYVILTTHWILLAPPASIIAIALGRGARRSLPSSATRDRRVALAGMILAVLPLGLIMLGMVAFTLLIGYSIVTGNHSLG